MKKVELVFFRECPTVPNARRALKDAGIEFVEVVQEELEKEDPRNNVCSPTLLVDGEVLVGSWAKEASCALDRWDSPDTLKLLRGLAGEPRSIGCCIRVRESNSKALTRGQRGARVVVGALLLGGGLSVLSSWPLALIVGWFGLSHVVAGITGYAGCPELGAIPSVLLGRSLATRCGPWEWFDKKVAR